MKRRHFALAALAACGCGGDSGTNPSPSTTGGIAEARAAVDGPAALAIAGVTVTYLIPQVGNPASDPAGFTVQKSATDPALFIAVDPATLSPAAAVGDVVSFTITQMGTASAQRRALTIANYARQSTGANVAALAQNVSAATDLVSAVNNYDAELVTVTGTIAAPFAGAGFAIGYSPEAHSPRRQ